MITTSRIIVEVTTRDSAPDGIAEQTVVMSADDPDAQEFLMALADAIQLCQPHNLEVRRMEPRCVIFDRNGGAGLGNIVS